MLASSIAGVSEAAYWNIETTSRLHLARSGPTKLLRNQKLGQALRDAAGKSRSDEVRRLLDARVDVTELPMTGALPERHRARKEAFELDDSMTWWWRR